MTNEIGFPGIPVASFLPEQLDMLDAPLDGRLLKERQGAGSRMLKYLDGSTVIRTANRIFGKGKWGFRIVSRSHERIEAKDGSYKEYFTADIELYVLGNPFPFPGDGIGAVKSSTVEGIEMARKDAVTDALKRALCYYGDQFGLALRDEEQMVEMGDGVLVKVREVQVNKQGENTVRTSAKTHQVSTERVVESRPPVKTKATSQPAQTDEKPDDEMQLLIKKADKFCDGGWKGLRGYMIRKYSLGDIPINAFSLEHRKEMRDLITTSANRPPANQPAQKAS